MGGRLIGLSSLRHIHLHISRVSATSLIDIGRVGVYLKWNKIIYGTVLAQLFCYKFRPKEGLVVSIKYLNIFIRLVYWFSLILYSKLFLKILLTIRHDKALSKLFLIFKFWLLIFCNYSFFNDCSILSSQFSMFNLFVYHLW